MTKTEFEQAYAEKAGLSLERLRELNAHTVPCECGDNDCCGWDMVFPEPDWMKFTPVSEILKAAHGHLKENITGQPLGTEQPLPCPFCGHKPQTGPREPGSNGDGWGFVMCVNLSCSAKPNVRVHNGVPDNSAGHIKAAVKRWNTRSESNPKKPVDDHPTRPDERDTMGSVDGLGFEQHGINEKASGRLTELEARCTWLEKKLVAYGI